jgi:hypothetical protein
MAVLLKGIYMPTRNNLEETLNSIVLSNNFIDAIVIFDGKSGLKLISNTKHNSSYVSIDLFSKSEHIAASLSQMYVINSSLNFFSEVSNSDDFKYACFYTKKMTLLIYFFEKNSYLTYIAFIGGDIKKRDIMRNYIEDKINEIFNLIVSDIL